MIEKLRKTVFLLPEGSNKVLTDVGWEFASSTFLSEAVTQSLMDSLGLSLTEEFLGIQVYKNELLQANVQKSDMGSVEFIYFQCDASFLAELKKELSKLTNAEIFIP